MKKLVSLTFMFYVTICRYVVVLLQFICLMFFKITVLNAVFLKLNCAKTASLANTFF